MVLKFIRYVPGGIKIQHDHESCGASWCINFLEQSEDLIECPECGAMLKNTLEV